MIAKVNDRAIRTHLVKLLTSSDAHANFDTAFRKMPFDFQGNKPAGGDHSPWDLLEHLRIAQWDILEFSRNAHHVSPDFPGGYWPKSHKPPDDKAWQKAVKSFQADLKAMVELIEDNSKDLLAPIPHGDGQTLLREALVLADHNSYHLGQLVQVRKELGAWKE